MSALERARTWLAKSLEHRPGHVVLKPNHRMRQFRKKSHAQAFATTLKSQGHTVHHVHEHPEGCSVVYEHKAEG